MRFTIAATLLAAAALFGAGSASVLPRDNSIAALLQIVEESLPPPVSVAAKHPNWPNPPHPAAASPAPSPEAISKLESRDEAAEAETAAAIVRPLGGERHEVPGHSWKCPPGFTPSHCVVRMRPNACKCTPGEPSPPLEPRDDAGEQEPSEIDLEFGAHETGGEASIAVPLLGELRREIDGEDGDVTFSGPALGDGKGEVEKDGGKVSVTMPGL